MFKQILNTDFFQLEETKALNTVIKSDRLKYLPVFKEVRRGLIGDPNVVLSNLDMLINKLKSIKTSKDINIEVNEIQTNMVIYSTHTRRTTTLIANIIHEHFGKFVQMRSIIPNEEYEILYNMRSIIKMYRIDKYKNVELDKLFNTIKIDNIQYFPVEIEIMDLYHKLYLPNFYEEWPELLKNEIKLYEIFDKKMRSEINGGKIECVSCKEKRHIDINNVKLLMLNFLNNENFVIVGKWIQYLQNKIKDIPDDSIQIISENDIEMDYKNIITFLSKFTNYGIFFKKRKMYIPKNNRIIKYTIYIKYPTILSRSSRSYKGSSGIDKPFIDIYNCASYELIPYSNIQYKKNNLRIGNRYVILYFSLIDLWLLRLIKYLKGINEEIFYKKYKETISFIKYAKKMPINYTNLFMGVNYDEKIAQKIIISKKQVKKTSYYPELSMKTNKKYKLIATSS